MHILSSIQNFINSLHNLDVLNNFFSQFGYITITFFEMLEGIGIPLPGETALLAASIYAANTGNFSITLVIFFSSLGTIIGDNAGYWIGRKYGIRIIEKYGHILHISNKELEKANKYFEKHGDKTVFIGRFFALLRMFASFLAGVNKMQYVKFFIYNALGGIAWSITYGLLGYWLGSNLNLLFSVIRKLSLIGTVFTVLVVCALIYLYIKNRKNEE